MAGQGCLDRGRARAARVASAWWERAQAREREREPAASPLLGDQARALGQAGAFTAVADDATAASWNPAGLIQLERSELSVVYRFSEQEDTHDSSNRDLVAGRDRYSSSELNYLSYVYPFRLSDHNVVVSLNYQESYDFTHIFTARFRSVDCLPRPRYGPRHLTRDGATFSGACARFFFLSVPPPVSRLGQAWYGKRCVMESHVV